jgi:hypothetical protein
LYFIPFYIQLNDKLDGALTRILLLELCYHEVFEYVSPIAICTIDSNDIDTTEEAEYTDSYSMPTYGSCIIFSCTSNQLLHYNFVYIATDMDLYDDAPPNEPLLSTTNEMTSPPSTTRRRGTDIASSSTPASSSSSTSSSSSASSANRGGTPVSSSSRQANNDVSIIYIHYITLLNM